MEGEVEEVVDAESSSKWLAYTSCFNMIGDFGLISCCASVQLFLFVKILMNTRLFFSFHS